MICFPIIPLLDIAFQSRQPVLSGNVQVYGNFKKEVKAIPSPETPQHWDYVGKIYYLILKGDSLGKFIILNIKG